ncbi:hypothetical protein [Desulfovibrio ferrophilus]|uniref:Uncharacterized protein n=1 Tax=Desulfovibrio ferrophilus TaxID=241368 RepID=A0A2Z6AUG3_9BACT|nr:hypothetical protein [Desulfovibrio ferrophilus]BBD06835.1 putative uncharacterized protein [Desulfovibrio ferrophilus]
MMKNYTEILDRLQKGLGKAYLESPLILGVPGVSVAVKIDPHYYLCVMPAFLSRLAELSGMFPDTAEQALIRTGSLITGVHGSHLTQVTVVWGSPPISRRVNASFVLAEFVDRALRLYGNQLTPMSVADLRITTDDQEAVAKFFDTKTCVDKTAFTQPV